MVRTYSFNPSTQSNIILNGRGTTPLPSLSSATTTLRSMTEKAQTTAGHTPRRIKKEQQQQIPFQDNQNSFNLNYSQMNGNNNSFEEVPFQQKQQQSPIVIEEEQTTLFGIRSILINGQRFFQPLDIPSSNQNQQRNQQTSAALVLALNGNNKNNGEHKTTSSVINGNGRINSDFKQQNHFFNDGIEQSTNFSTQNGNKMEEFLTNNFTSAFPDNGHNIIPNLQSIPKNNFVERQNYNLQQNNNLSNTLQRENNKEEEEGENDNVLPWARGCPQPKSGQRGSRSWMEGNEMIKRHGSAFERSFAATSSTASWPPPIPQIPERIVEQNFQRSASSIAPLSNISATERHRLELLHQIEENRRRRALEKQKEWEMEERERIRDERWRERQRAEIEAEKRAEREKALALERKAAKLAAAQKATEQALREEAQRLAEARAQRRRKQSGSNFSETVESVSDRSCSISRQIPVGNQSINIGEEIDRNKNEIEEEWWERKDSIYSERMRDSARNNNRPSSFRGRQQSPVVPALRKRLMENGGENQQQQELIQTQRSMSVGSRPGSRRSSVSSAFGRTSRHAYTPSIENRNNSNSIRNGIGRSRNGNRTDEN
uniref:Uncharacterized protein n=1 Tax=Meloidogyne enterolobii TaxID=390850 RepID=A0A6V7TXD0_MELEN|nr:unnamed protein product [Meloidogyne enterolobii]